MSYTIIIDSKNEQAQSIIEMLKALSKDYDFLQVIDNNELDDNKLSKLQLKELESRLNYVKKKSEKGKDWSEVYNKLLGDE